MSDIKIMFLHGREGTPEGTKPTFLKECGYKVIAPALPKVNWELSMRRAEDCFRNFQPDIIVGSSRGGAIAAALEVGWWDTPKILIAPAWTKFSVASPLINESTTILHCLEDDLVAYADSEELVRDYGCTLISCGQNHRMSDTAALEQLEQSISRRIYESTMGQ